MIYVLDANVFLTPANAEMTMEHCPGYWDWLRALSDQGTVRTTPRIRGECKNPAFVPEWMDDTTSLVPTDAETDDVVAAYATLQAWAGSRTGYLSDKRQVAFDEFANGADAWLIAYAMALTARGSKATVVTSETSEPARKSRLKIPDVCAEHGVPCMPWLTFYRAASPAPRFCWTP